MPLRPWQEQSVEHLLRVLERNGAAADLSDPGTGKTYTACAVAQALNLPTLVVDPKPLTPTWHRVAQVIGTEFDVLNYEKLRTGRTPYGQWVVPKGCRKERFQWNPGIGFLIFDEAHRCAGLQTKQSEMLMAARRQGIRTLILTATLADTPLELKAAGYVLGLHHGDDPPTLRNPNPVDFYQWARRHKCGKGLWSAFEFLGSKKDQVAVMEKIHRALLPDRGVRVRIEDLGDLFPTTQITAEIYDIKESGRVAELYAEMSEALGELKRIKAADADPKNPLTKLIRLRQEVELLKVPVFTELVEDARKQGQSTAIFVNFTRTLEELCRRLKTNCRIDGSQVGPGGARERQDCIDAFQSGASKEIVCNIASGSEGISLHGKNRLSLISPGLSAKQFKQVLRRVHRVDGEHSLQRVICIAGTVEETLAHNLSHKLDRLDALTDGDLSPV